MKRWYKLNIDGSCQGEHLKVGDFFEIYKVEVIFTFYD